MSLIEQIRSIRQSLPSLSPEDVDEREECLLEVRGLLLDLERPDNMLERTCFQLSETVAIYTAIKMKLFKELNRAPKSSTEDLAKACGADVILVGRLLRCMAAWGTIKENGPHSYSPTNASRAFEEPKNEAGVEFFLDILSHGWLAMPAFLQENKWQNPTSHTMHPIAKAFNKPEGVVLWDILKDHPALKAFNTYMAAVNEGHRQWYEFYPVLDRLGNGAEDDPSSVMMVDVGGGGGHQAINFRRQFPQLPGRYIVQDLAAGLPKDRTDEVEYMEHDFSTPQPIKGARFYYLRNVPHDWPQDYNVKLCSHLKDAMKPGYSRLIINEFVVPESGASKFVTAQDLNLLCAHGGMERTLVLHQEYLEKAGLKIVKVYTVGDKISESVIEAEIA